MAAPRNPVAPVKKYELVDFPDGVAAAVVVGIGVVGIGDDVVVDGGNDGAADDGDALLAAVGSVAAVVAPLAPSSSSSGSLHS